MQNTFVNRKLKTGLKKKRVQKKLNLNKIPIDTRCEVQK